MIVIRLPLKKNEQTVANRKRRDEVFKAWDARREEEGLGPWGVVYASSDGDFFFVNELLWGGVFDASSKGSSLPGLGGGGEPRTASCQKTKLDNVRIPEPSLTGRPSSSADKEKLDDWNADSWALFEWVGMAGLHSQR